MTGNKPRNFEDVLSRLTGARQSGNYWVAPCPLPGHKTPTGHLTLKDAGDKVVNGLGRKPLNIPLKNVRESLRAHRNVVAAAQELNCSQGYIFKVLKDNGLKSKDVIEGRP